MSYIQISTIIPNPDTILSPGAVTLNFSISADNGTPVTVYYNLNRDNNAYFVLNDGTLSKEIMKIVTIAGPLEVFNSHLMLRKVESSPENDYNYCYIYVQAINNLNKISDIKHCMISFV